jgi:hypothetical protein
MSANIDMDSDIESGVVQVVASPESLAAAGMRSLEWNELVRKGDFVADGHDGFEPWDGPSGFRADAFVKQIYRRNSKRVSPATNKRVTTESTDPSGRPGELSKR